MSVTHCPRCEAEVRDAGGFCLLGHPLYPWSDERAQRAARAGRRRRELGHAARGAAVALGIYAVVAGAVLQLRGTASIEPARYEGLQSTRPDDFNTTPRKARRRGPIAPKAVMVWRLGIYAPIESVGLESDGSLEVPDDAAEAGWFDGGPTPGRRGSAVIVGHFDSRTGPGVFFGLRKLRPGDEVGVVDRSGNEFVFEIDRVEQVDKDLFPTKSVYAPTKEPTLRLITCEGDIDPVTGHYADNLIAYGKLVDS
jgi:hypothetical protein